MDRPPIASMSQGGLDLSFPLSAEQTGGVMSVIQIQVAPGWRAARVLESERLAGAAGAGVRSGGP